ncbi:hypothetical protein [Nocardiopsis nanhaiensis]
MLTTTTHRRRTVLLCGAALLLGTATACGEGHGHSPQQLSEMIAETVRDSTDSADSALPGLGVPDTAFDPARYACAPAVDPAIPGSWRSEAPRAEVEAADEDTVELGLSDSEGQHSGAVLVTVIDPDGGTTSHEAELADGEWAHLDYPDDFGSDGLAPGVHTVLWSDAESGAPITCDGFEVD